MTIPRGNRALILLAGVLLGLCAFGAYRGVAATHMVLTGQALDKTGLFRYPLWGIAHFATAFLFTVMVPLQLWPAFRNRHRSLHRWSGRALLAGGVVLATSGLLLVYHMPDRPLGERVFMTVVFTIFVASLVNAVRAARARDFARHREWVIRAVAVALGSMTQRLLLPLFLATGIHGAADFWDKFVAAAWLSAVLNLSVAEWWIRRTAPAITMRRPAPQLAAYASAP